MNATEFGIIATLQGAEPVYIEMIFEGSFPPLGEVPELDETSLPNWLDFFYPEHNPYGLGEEPFIDVIVDRFKITLIPNENEGNWIRHLRKDIFNGSPYLISFIDTGYFTSTDT